MGTERLGQRIRTAGGGANLFFQQSGEEEEPEPAPAHRAAITSMARFASGEPEPEPDMADIPTVSRYMGESGDSDDISLDQLLDEIIKAGE